MSIRIVTDSTCDLPAPLIQDLGITVIPLFINIAEKGYLDGIDLSREAFYARLPDFPSPPSTAAPGPEVFRRAYEQLAEEGAQQILSIHIANSLSATPDVAQVAAQETKRVPVTVFDSRQLSLGTGFQVIKAAKAAAEGKSVDETLALLEDQIARTHVFAALDTLEFLKRSGRMNWAVASLGTLLKIKPILKMYDGNPTSERVRTNNGAILRLLSLLEEQGPFESVAMVHTNAPEKAESLRQMASHLFPDHQESLSVNVTSVIGAHIGPGAVGFACISAG